MRKILVPAAGLGTRFYPFTEAVPKELLPLMNRPVASYLLDEFMQAGFDDLVVVVSDHKKSFEDYAAHYWVGAQRDAVRSMVSIRQSGPFGLGHAVWSARAVYHDEFVAIALPDNIFLTEPVPWHLMLERAQRTGGGVIGVSEVAPEAVSRYGIAVGSDFDQEGFFSITEMVEKPAKGRVRSRYAIAGRYVLPFTIFQALTSVRCGVGNEIQLTDALQQLMMAGVPFYAYPLPGLFLDIGTPEGWLEANIMIGAGHSPSATARKTFTLKEQ
jgi:UTP--glucose-1-phosphate uridylyltransferase